MDENIYRPELMNDLVCAMISGNKNLVKQSVSCNIFYQFRPQAIEEIKRLEQQGLTPDDIHNIIVFNLQ